jgi:hypothetical protein
MIKNLSMNELTWAMLHLHNIILAWSWAQIILLCRRWDLLDFICDAFPYNHEWNWVKRNCRRSDIIVGEIYVADVKQSIFKKRKMKIEKIHNMGLKANFIQIANTELATETFHEMH